MPVIDVKWTGKMTAQQKNAVINNAADVVCTAIKVPAEIVNVIITEIEEGSYRFPTAVFDISWSKNENRSKAAKAEIAEKITEKVLEISDFTPNRVVIFFHDLEGEDVGVAGELRA